MFRRLATQIDPADVLGVTGILCLIGFAALIDPRLLLAVAGVLLVIVALVMNRPAPPAPPAQPTE